MKDKDPKPVTCECGSTGFSIGMDGAEQIWTCTRCGTRWAYHNDGRVWDKRSA